MGNVLTIKVQKREKSEDKHKKADLKNKEGKKSTLSEAGGELMKAIYGEVQTAASYYSCKWAIALTLSWFVFQTELSDNL